MALFQTLAPRTRVGGIIGRRRARLRRYCGAVGVVATCDYRVGRASTYVPLMSACGIAGRAWF